MKKIRHWLIVALFAPALAFAGMALTPGTTTHTHADANTGGASLSGTTCTNCTITGGSVSSTTTLASGSGASLVLLSTKTASNSASLTFTSSDFDWTAYDSYVVKFIQIIPTTNNSVWEAQISEDGGSTWKSGASTYSSLQVEATSTPTGPTATSVNATAWVFDNLGISSSTDYGLNGDCEIFGPSVAIKKLVLCRFVFDGISVSLIIGNVGVQYSGDAGAWNGIKFFMNSGNFGGKVAFYGRRKT
jgi:hypothetical protein